MTRILALFLALSPFSLIASIAFTPNVRTGVAAFDQQPVLASNGFDYLAAWTTRRPYPYGSGIYTARIAADGTVSPFRAVDPTGFFLPEVETHPHGVSVTAGRDGYFLAWLSDEGLSAAITDSYGAIEHKITVPQASTAGWITAAWNGSAHLVLNTSPSGPFSATLFDNNGEVMQANVVIGDAHGDTSVRTTVVADDDGFLLLSTKTISGSRSDLYGRRVTSSGVPGEWFFIRSMASRVGAVAAVFDGSRDLVVWVDTFGLWMLPLDTHSNAAGASRQLLPGPLDSEITAMWSNDRLWIAYRGQEQQTAFLTVSATGVISPPVIFPSGVFPPDLSSNGSNVLSLRSVSGPLTFLDAIGSFVTPEKTAADFVVTASQTNQQNGELATDGNKFLAVWDEIVPPGREVFASIIAPGSGVATKEIQLSTGGANTSPAVSYNGSEYLVAWARTIDENQSEIVVRRLSPDGALLDVSEVVVGAGSQPRVASDGTNWLIVWEKMVPGSWCPFGNGGPKIFAARVGPTGVVLDPDGVALAPEIPRQQGHADVTWSGSQYVAVWAESCSAYHSPTVTAISAATMAPDLSHVGAAPVSAYASDWYGDFVDWPYGTGVDRPRVTASTDRILVAWTETTRGPQPPFSTFTRVRYRLSGSDFTERAGGRQRSATLKPAPPAIDAALIGVGHDPDGQMFILGKATIPTAIPYEGLYRWNVSLDAPPTNTGMRFVFSREQQLAGTPVRLGNQWWMPESIFSPSAGAYRLYARDFN